MSTTGLVSAVRKLLIEIKPSRALRTGLPRLGLHGKTVPVGQRTMEGDLATYQAV